MATLPPDPPATAPSRSQDNATFSAAIDAFLAWVVELFAWITIWYAEIIQIGTATYTGTSSSSVAIGTGTKNFTASTGRGWVPGQNIIAAYDASNYMNGTVTTYDSVTGALVMNVTSVVGSGTRASWSIGLAGVSVGQLGTLNISDIAAAASDVWTGTTAVKFVTPDALYDAADGQTLTDGATVTPDFGAGLNFKWTIGGNRTLANPTNAKSGQSGVIVITQDGTGSRVISYGSNWRFAGGAAASGVLSTAAGSVDALSYYVRSDGTILATLAKAFAA